MISPAEAFAKNSAVWTDIQDHLPMLFEVAKGNVMEIGVRGGASTSALLAGVEKHGGHLWSVDVNNCRIFDHPQWTFIQADSIQQRQALLKTIPEDLDVLFVDGDHSYEGCLSDLRTFGIRAKLILIHDCLCPDTFPGVRQASEEYAASLGVPLEIREGSYGMGVIRVPESIQRAIRIPGWMTGVELQWLAEQASKHEVVVEVGCYQGRSTTAIAHCAKGIVYAVDDWNGLREKWWVDATTEVERQTLYERFSANLKGHIASGKVNIVKADHEKVEPFTCDFVFIDGDHRSASVKRDIEKWKPFVRSGGMMAGHDFNQPDVIQAVQECLPGAVKVVGLIWKWEKK